MKAFIQGLEVVNWNNIASAFMKFDRYNRNFVNVVVKDSIPRQAIHAILGNGGSNPNSLPANHIIKLDILHLEESDDQCKENVIRYIKVDGNPNVFCTKLNRSNSEEPLFEVFEQDFSTSVLNINFEDTLKFGNGSEQFAVEPQAKIQKTEESQLDKLQNIVSQLNSSEVAEAELNLLHISSISRIMEYLTDGKATLCFGFSSEDSENLNKISKSAIVSYFEMKDSNRRVESKFALPEFIVLANISLELSRMFLIQPKSIPIIPIDPWLLQQTDILNKIVSLVEEMQIAVIFEVQNCQDVNHFCGVNIWKN
ncbi:hypothetical protein ACFFRR_001907 [Megaselia abdita]